VALTPSHIVRLQNTPNIPTKNTKGVFKEIKKTEDHLINEYLINN
jgi:hypothetical protein